MNDHSGRRSGRLRAPIPPAGRRIPRPERTLTVIEGGADPAPWAARRAARLAEEEAWIGRAAVGRARRLVEIEAAEKREAERPLHFKTVDALAKRLGQAVQDGATGPLRGPPFG